jgi:hypothetical protein
MNERQLGRLLKRILLLTAPLPAAWLASACGGTTMSEPGGGGEATTAGSGTGGSAGGSSGGGASKGGMSAGGAHSPGGSASGASMGGASMGGASMGGASMGGASMGGAAGATLGGSGGADACHGPIPVGCISTVAMVPRGCVPAAATPGTQLTFDTCNMICGSVPLVSCSLAAVTDTTVSVNCSAGCAVGRRPPGFCPAAFFETQALGQYFAQLSELEAASIDAFRILRDELRIHGAPKRLVRAAGRAARDEIRHARAMRALARRSGSEPRLATRVRTPQRSLEALARENAVEGCVRETFGALLATWQAKAAADPVVRAAMLRISRDETRHAALSWQVHRWLATRLDSAARTRVAAARNDAALELVAAIRAEATPSFAERVGLPERVQSQQLVARMARELWS